MVYKRTTFLFHSTKGLVLLAIMLISFMTAFFGMLSGPMAEFGFSEIFADVTGMSLIPAEREGRIILLYHTIAMAVVAINVYLITGSVPLRDYFHSIINGVITFGYITAMLFGILFAYFGHNFIYHGLYLFGTSLVFFAGVLLAVALWPWKEEVHVKDPAYSHLKSGVDLERVAFFVMTVATLGSATFGAVTGSYWGSGHETFLAEDLIREPEKTVLQNAIIGHLHIMLTLIGISVALLIGRWFDFKGILHKIAMPLMILGTIVITIGAWSVVLTEYAHTIIYGGSVMVLLAGLILVIFAWRKLIHTGLAESGKHGFFASLGALFRDPLRFGATWQMVFMNFTVSFIGIFVAVKLDEIFRIWPLRDERVILTGHWHVLSGIIATIILLYYADLAGLKGKVRKVFGWAVVIFSDLAFTAITIFEMKRLFVSEAEQQPLVNATMLLVDIGIVVVLLALAMLLIWRLADFFKKDGRWTEELREEGLDKPPQAPPPLKAPLLSESTAKEVES